MTEYAPQTLLDLYDRIKLGSKEFSGIVGDKSHTYGYHRGRNHVSPADYSVVLQADKGGGGEAAAALDVKLNAADMKLVTGRLMVACRSNDPRVGTLREFFGTLDGQRVTGWDRHDPSTHADDGFTSSDDTHLWHIHLSFYRSQVASSVILAVADVINGVPVPHPKPVTPSGAEMHAAWPSWMGSGDYFGLETGPDQSHGGRYPRERTAVTSIQRRLTQLGYSPGAADGHFGPATKAAVAKWQHAHAPGTTRYGEIWSDDWKRLFTW